MPEIRTNASVVWTSSIDLAHGHYSIPGTLFVLFVKKKKKKSVLVRAGQKPALAPPHRSSASRPCILDGRPGSKSDGAAGNVKFRKHFWVSLLFHVNFCLVKVVY